MKEKKLFASVLSPVIGAIFLLTGVASAEQPIVEPIVALKVKSNHVFKDDATKGLTTESVWDKPIVIESDEDASKHFDKDALKALQDAVDWEKQFVLVFVWAGSGQDKLEYKVLESSPEQIAFTMTEGMTEDLRLHKQVFVLRSGVKWWSEKMVGACIFPPPFQGNPGNPTN